MVFKPSPFGFRAPTLQPRQEYSLIIYTSLIQDSIYQEIETIQHTTIAEEVTTNRRKSLQMQRIHKYTSFFLSNINTHLGTHFTKFDPIPDHNHSPKGSGLKINQT